ncbi:MAG: hypothetical protein HYZ16_03055 [Bacteroidetes bacterium]|jgi:hypothetical protein|nr:hypothetical protein [Bacteroidota bacterium]
MLLAVAEIQAQSFSYSTPLLARRAAVIGEVLVERNGDSLDVTYVVTDSNWFITKTYLHVSPTANGFPVNGLGVPDIQNFDHKTDHNNVFFYKYDNIDVTGMTYTYVSANANVTEQTKCTIDTADINAVVPTGTVFMLLSQTIDPVYFNMLIYDYSGNLLFYDYFFGNCVDLTNPIYEGVYYFPKLLSSYSGDTAALNCLVDRPENLDLINYIINQPFDTIYGAKGPEIQAAIWTIIDNDVPINGAFGLYWDQSIVDKVVADAKAKGEYYIPPCDGYFAVLVDQGCLDAIANNTTPNISVQQSIMWLPVSKVPAAYDYSYGECANAWGVGKKFTNAGWGQFFEAK